MISESSTNPAFGLAVPTWSEWIELSHGTSRIITTLATSAAIPAIHHPSHQLLYKLQPSCRLLQENKSNVGNPALPSTCVPVFVAACGGTRLARDREMSTTKTAHPQGIIPPAIAQSDNQIQYFLISSIEHQNHPSPPSTALHPCTHLVYKLGNIIFVKLVNALLQRLFFPLAACHHHPARVFDRRVFNRRVI
jgi:hypothetical protein